MFASLITVSNQNQKQLTFHPLLTKIHIAINILSQPLSPPTAGCAEAARAWGRGGSSNYRRSGLSATSQSISSHSRRCSTKKPRCFTKGGSSERASTEASRLATLRRRHISCSESSSYRSERLTDLGVRRSRQRAAAVQVMRMWQAGSQSYLS
jgi:hypothetical protein